MIKQQFTGLQKFCLYSLLCPFTGLFSEMFFSSICLALAKHAVQIVECNLEMMI